jgi:PAS domain S-box-containing protein
LEALNNRYSQRYDQAPIGYLTVGAQDLILEANLTASAILGVARSQLVNSSLIRFITHKHLPLYTSLRHQLLQSGNLQLCELQMIRADGSRFWASLMATATKLGDEGDLLCLIALGDISLRKQAEKERDELQLANQHLQRSESLARMAGAIAHHFNNQLQVVILNLEVALQSQESGATVAESLAGAMEASLKAAKMSSLMLTYLGQHHGSLQHIDLAQACQHLLPMLQSAIPQTVSFEINLPTPGPTIRAHPSQIQQVLMNLLTNAWEACSGSPNIIRLSSSTVAGSSIPPTNRHPIDRLPGDFDYACLEVADSGSGIPVWDIHLIFDPFFSTKFTGRGLGLPVVLGIIRSIHGFITFESKQGSGSKFRVFIPVTANALPLPPFPVALPTPGTGLGTVSPIASNPVH